MANEYLDNLAARGLLKPEASTADEIRGLIHSGAARLVDAKNPDLSLESRFDLAYNAAHALSLAGLRIAGYRANNRYAAIYLLLCRSPHILSEHGCENRSQSFQPLDA